MRRALSRWWPRLLMVGTVAVWLATAIDLTLRDRMPMLAPVFYATPTIVLGVLALILAALQWCEFRGSVPDSNPPHCSPSPRGSVDSIVPSNQPRHTSLGDILRERWCCVVVATALLGIVCIGRWLFGNVQSTSTHESASESLKVVFWNVGRGDFASWDRIAEELAGFDADVLALVEATSDEVQTREFWQTRLPGYSALPLHSGMVLLVKGEAVQAAAGPLERGGRFRRVAVEVRGVRFDVIVADIVSSPIRPRGPPLGKLFEIMQAQGTTPTLVVGDFNTPPTSVWFDRWRADWSRAWEVAGSGYQATWPQPLPVLTLDHVWGNRGITFQRCLCGWSRCSDHRPVIVEAIVRD